MTGPLLELDRVTKRFGRVVIAEDLSLTVGPGDTVGIVGPNGAGKTSLFGLISGDLTPGGGEIRFAGRAVTKLDAAARCRLGVGRTYQVPRPFVDMTAFDASLNAYAAAVREMDDYGRANPNSFFVFESQPRSLLGKLREFRDNLARAKGDARRARGCDMTWIVNDYNMMISSSQSATQFNR